MDFFDPAVITECLGSLFYALPVSLNAMGGQDWLKQKFATGAVFANTASFMSRYFALGDVSGKLFNPAITLACLGKFFDAGRGFGKDRLINPKVSMKDGPKYSIAPLDGAAGGAARRLLV